MSRQQERDWQRLDQWLWCARFLRQRADCARLAAQGGIRINRLPTDKPHARLHVGDVITLALRSQVRVLRVLSLADRRGPATQARALYQDIAEAASCADAQSQSYAATEAMGLAGARELAEAPGLTEAWGLAGELR